MLADISNVDAIYQEVCNTNFYDIFCNTKCQFLNGLKFNFPIHQLLRYPIPLPPAVHYNIHSIFTHKKDAGIDSLHPSLEL